MITLLVCLGVQLFGEHAHASPELNIRAQKGIVQSIYLQLKCLFAANMFKFPFHDLTLLVG